ncbi:MAG TPA: M20/M25/M40 family metallo-hydrolase [Woeseiaceae bacterium]|nr:M20/M25/M40 family metallo-hydrolase [Woeseiaceae bacterium]
MTRRSIVLLAALLTAAACDPVTVDVSVNEAPVTRPKFSIETDEAFSSASIGQYAGNHSDVYAHIDSQLDAHIANIQRWLRQPSISAQNNGIQEMATLLRDDLLAMGFQEAELVPTDGHPGVWGYYDAGADKTLMLYLMYDVQPVDEEDWQSPPFAAELVEHELGTVLMARGATNQKGPQRAFLNAVQSIIDVRGELPVNLMVTAEGEEELGSPHYPQIIDKYEERLKAAEGAIFPFNSQRPDGSLSMTLGVKGIIYFELEAKGNADGGPTEAEIHGSYKALVDSPVLRLVQAIASMTSKDGNTILIPGYYDGILPPNHEEQVLMNGVLATSNDDEIKAQLGVQTWLDGLAGADAITELLFMPTLNIDGIWAGYTGEGTKTILPHMATAKMDSRLPPGLDPDAALQKIRAHLDANGFADIELRRMSAYPAAQTSVSAPLVQAALSVANKYTERVAVNPRLAGSAPFYQFTERLGIPMVPFGIGYGTGAHAPNEIMLIKPKEGLAVAGLAEIEKSYVDFLYALAEK